MNDDMKDFELDLKDFDTQILEDIKNDLKYLYRKAIQESVYDRYSPTEYVRSYELRDSIRVEFKDGALYIFNDINDLYYESAIDGRLTSSIIPYLVEGGHKDDTGIHDAYHDYGGRHFLEVAKEMITSKYPDVKCEIINDKPQWI
jgi:hypothetical protein